MMPASPAMVDLGRVLDRGRWTTIQKLFTVLAAIAVAFDGFDIQILGFAIPSIMREWQIARGEFALVLAIGLAGMAGGSPLAGYLGDRLGRRKVLIACVTLFGAATVATAFAHGMTELSVLRFFTGLGAGGALPNASTLAAEFAPRRRRAIAVTLTIVCVPLGGMIGGALAAKILPAWGWHVLYLVGGAAPLLLSAVLLWALPESPRYLVRHPARWKDLTKLLHRMGHPVPSGCLFEDAVEEKADRRPALQSILGPEYLRNTLGLWLAFFTNLTAIYLVFGWLPAMLTAQGIDVGTASSGLAAYNFGGVLGVLIWAAMLNSIGSRQPLIWGAIGAAASAFALQYVRLGPEANHLLMIGGFGLHGLFVNAVQTCMFALCAHVYPTKVRALGVSIGLAVGRAGAFVSSFIGAAIIQSGSGWFLKFLALAMMGTAVGVAIVSKHIGAREGQAE